MSADMKRRQENDMDSAEFDSSEDLFVEENAALETKKTRVLSFALNVEQTKKHRGDRQEEEKKLKGKALKFIFTSSLPGFPCEQTFYAGHDVQHLKFFLKEHFQEEKIADDFQISLNHKVLADITTLNEIPVINEASPNDEIILEVSAL